MKHALPRPRWSVALALALAGCAGTVDVQLTVRSQRATAATLLLERHPADGPAEVLHLGRLLPGGKNTAWFVGERGGRLVLQADRQRVDEREIPRDAPDPFVVEMRVD